jgi:hypothetical protein
MIGSCLLLTIGWKSLGRRDFSWNSTGVQFKNILQKFIWYSELKHYCTDTHFNCTWINCISIHIHSNDSIEFLIKIIQILIAYRATRPITSEPNSCIELNLLVFGNSYATNFPINYKSVYLQSISTYFSLKCSELRSELRKFVAKFKSS